MNNHMIEFHKNGDHILANQQIKKVVYEKSKKKKLLQNLICQNVKRLGL